MSMPHNPLSLKYSRCTALQRYKTNNMKCNQVFEKKFHENFRKQRHTKQTETTTSLT